VTDIIDTSMMVCLVLMGLSALLLSIIQIRIFFHSSLSKFAFQPLNETELRLRKYAGLLFFIGITMLFILGYVETTL